MPSRGSFATNNARFSYIKYSASISRNIAIDSNPMEYERHETQYEFFIPDFLQDYPDAKEEIDP